LFGFQWLWSFSEIVPDRNLPGSPAEANATRDPSTVVDLCAWAPRSILAQDDKTFRIRANPWQRISLLHEAARIFSGGAAYCQAVDLQCRDAYAYWHGLAVFAAGADAFVELQVISNHRNTR